MTTTTLFAHNKSTGNVSLLSGRVYLPVGGKLAITTTEAEHEDVIYAKRLGWISIEGEVSSTDTPTAVAVIQEDANPMRGSDTIEEAVAEAEVREKDRAEANKGKKAKTTAPTPDATPVEVTPTETVA